jgi:hypothetical protein
MVSKSKMLPIIGLLLSVLLWPPVLYSQTSSPVFVDSKGVMRWSNSEKEASFFGVNYTLPFAFSYRAAGYLDIDRKSAIDQDVYHFARLGFNAFRIHIWDVEISGNDGSLIVNDHLDLLDYLISKLSERGIYTVITAQTNFGNGYPERNIFTDGFSYLHDKCDIHRNEKAISAQERYIGELVGHKNHYTGVKYKDDPFIVGFEINNEPCHVGSVAETKNYIARMVKALNKAGNKKPVFYNVSHNLEHVDAYFSSDIDGTTYQWYPSGLVSGGERKENYLPHVDNYSVPFNDIKGYKRKAKLIYEFDPADISGSYLYPATVRSLRSAGFQWITQFCYDPLVLASSNTEYPTHYLNLAYTPGKAVSMRIAAMASQVLPLYSNYGTYPENTQFGDFRVSYEHDLSEFNNGECFFYSNNTLSKPKNAKSLRSIAGVGSSSVVSYSGSGAYFIDKLEDGVWRLEVMPDVVNVSDPFAKPAFNKEVRRIYYMSHNMKIDLPDIGSDFSIKGVNAGNDRIGMISNGVIDNIKAGVYVLTSTAVKPKHNWTTDSKFGNISISEYAAPVSSENIKTIYHEPAKYAMKEEPLTIKATIASGAVIDSVVVYTDRISFWNDHNPYYKMVRTVGNSYETVIPANELEGSWLNYNIVMYSANSALTAPAMISKAPLDWDYIDYKYYSTKIMKSKNNIILYSAGDNRGLFVYAIPKWSQVNSRVVEGGPTAKNTFRLDANGGEEYVVIRKNIEDEITIFSRNENSDNKSFLCVDLREAKGRLLVGFVTKSGVSFKKVIDMKGLGVIRIAFDDFVQSPTWLLPQAYPSFLTGKYDSPIMENLTADKIQSLEISIMADNDITPSLEIGDVWLEQSRK